MGKSLPAWPFLLGALLLVIAGVNFLVNGSAGLAMLLFLAGFASGALGIRQGHRAMMQAGPVQGVPVAPSAPSPPAAAPAPKTTGALSAYYENEDAVRAMQKESRRLCKECGSPVLEKAAECPTCGSRV